MKTSKEANQRNSFVRRQIAIEKMGNRGGVRVLPKRMLDEGNQILPQEPTDAPPPPEKLVSLVIVGDAQAGKSSLVKSFMSHESLPLEGREDNKHGQTPKQNWSVAYSKKDLVFCNDRNCIISMRVQIWDTSGVSPHIPLTDSERTREWAMMWKPASCILILLSLRDPLHLVIKKIKDWAKWLENERKNKSVALILHQGDQLKSQYGSSVDFIRFGKRVSEICNNFQITSWNITSSCLEDEELGGSIDAAFREILGSLGKAHSVPRTITPQANMSQSTDTALLSSPENKTTASSSRSVSPLP